MESQGGAGPAAQTLSKVNNSRTVSGSQPLLREAQSTTLGSNHGLLCSWQEQECLLFLVFELCEFGGEREGMPWR